ncbi:hypothetical protein EGK69_007535 [Citrobacter freundii]|nr:hypothetical protein EGK69_007535 [Citrobacter freundii]
MKTSPQLETTPVKELVAAGHALAKELHCAESAALVRNLATALDVQLARANAPASLVPCLMKLSQTTVIRSTMWMDGTPAAPPCSFPFPKRRMANDHHRNS